MEKCLGLRNKAGLIFSLGLKLLMGNKFTGCYMDKCLGHLRGGSTTRA